MQHMIRFHQSLQKSKKCFTINLKSAMKTDAIENHHSENSSVYNIFLRALYLFVSFFIVFRYFPYVIFFQKFANHSFVNFRISNELLTQMNRAQNSIRKPDVKTIFPRTSLRKSYNLSVELSTMGDLLTLKFRIWINFQIYDV